jgi:hypothetical protein
VGCVLVLEHLNLIVTGIDARLRDLELWRAGQTSADNVAREALDQDRQQRGLTLTERQANIALASVAIPGMLLIGTIITLIVTGGSQAL